MVFQKHLIKKSDMILGITSYTHLFTKEGFEINAGEAIMSLKSYYEKKVITILKVLSGPRTFEGFRCVGNESFENLLTK